MVRDSVSWNQRKKQRHRWIQNLLSIYIQRNLEVYTIKYALGLDLIPGRGGEGFIFTLYLIFLSEAPLGLILEKN